MRLVICSFLCGLMASAAWAQTPDGYWEAQRALQECEQLRKELEQVKKALAFFVQHCPECQAALKAKQDAEAQAKVEKAEAKAQAADAQLKARTVSSVAADGSWVEMQDGFTWNVHPSHRKTVADWNWPRGTVLQVFPEASVKNGDDAVYRIRVAADKPSILVSLGVWNRSTSKSEQERDGADKLPFRR